MKLGGGGKSINIDLSNLGGRVVDGRKGWMQVSFSCDCSFVSRLLKFFGFCFVGRFVFGIREEERGLKGEGEKEGRKELFFVKREKVRERERERERG